MTVEVQFFAQYYVDVLYAVQGDNGWCFDDDTALISITLLQSNGEAKLCLIGAISGRMDDFKRWER